MGLRKALLATAVLVALGTWARGFGGTSHRSDDLPALELLRIAASGPRTGSVPAAAAFAELSRLPAETRRAVVEQTLVGERRGEVRAVALELLRPIAEHQDVTLGYALATAGLVEDGLEESVAVAFVDWVEDLHTRDRRAGPALLSEFGKQPIYVQALVIEGISRYVHARSAALLAHILTLSEDTRIALLVPLARMKARLPGRPEEGYLRDVRAGLLEPNPRLRSEAALAVGWLGDESSVPTLIALLKDPDRAPRQAALWSLRRISGLNLRGAQTSWQRWFDESELWWSTRSEDCFRVLGSGEAPEVLAALQEIGRQRLGRERILKELEVALDMDSDEVVETTCAILARLGDARCVPALARVLLLDHPRKLLAATDALRALTGAQLPADYAAWSAWIQGQ